MKPRSTLSRPQFERWEPVLALASAESAEVQPTEFDLTPNSMRALLSDARLAGLKNPTWLSKIGRERLATIKISVTPHGTILLRQMLQTESVSVPNDGTIVWRGEESAALLSEAIPLQKVVCASEVEAFEVEAILNGLGWEFTSVEGKCVEVLQ